MRKRPNALMLGAAAIMSLSGDALGQVTVPWTQCYARCSHPRDVDPCCSPSWITATCTRFDSKPVVVFPGTPVAIPSDDFEFICENCCKFEPDECPGNDINPPMRECVLNPSLTFTESISLSVSGSITVSIRAVELALEGGVGVTRGREASVSLTCPLSAPKCKSVACKPRINYLANRSVRVDHTWTAKGAWINYGCTCPIAGNVWIVPTTACSVDSSTAVGDKLVSAVCGSPYAKECPERAPCN